MSAKTGIEWTDATWNPVVGCDQISPGCAHCYAKELHDLRHRAFQQGKVVARQYAHPFETVQLKPERLTQPLEWRKGRRIFVNSVADLFHDAVPFEFIASVWATMALARHHRFQILTKRPARMLAVLTDPGFYAAVLRSADLLRVQRPWLTEIAISDPTRRPLLNAWLGVSVENQRFADERIPLLQKAPAMVRFLSCEPLLGSVDLRPHLWSGHLRKPLDWVIIGGESGPRARPFSIEWAFDIIAQCRVANVATFVKQLGAVPMEAEAEWRARPLTRLLSPKNRDRVPEGFVPLYIADAKGGDIDTWPAELRVREFPTVRA